MIHLPIEPLERWFMITHPASHHSVAEQEDITGRPTARRLADATGFETAAIWRWRRHGIPYWSADRAATELGLHPTALWDNWFAIDPRDRRFEIPEWFAELRRTALVESWQLRAELDGLGTATVLARNELTRLGLWPTPEREDDAA